MSLKLKLATAFACSLLLMAALCWFFLSGRGTPREAPATAPVESRRPPAPARITKAKPREKRAVPPREQTVLPVPDPVPTAGWRISGRVVHEDGAGSGAVEPVGGAVVRLASQPRRRRAALERQQTIATRPDGRFAFEHVLGNHWLRLEIDAPPSAYLRFSFQLGEPQGSASRDLGDILLEPASTLTIQLRGPGGEPASGGRVLVRRKDSRGSPLLAYLGIAEARVEAVEKEPGVYLFERAAPGWHALHAVAPGCAEARADVNLPRKTPLILRLGEGARISGRILTAEGAPIAKAELEVLDGPGARELAPHVEADGAGRFVFDTLLEGEYDIGIEATGFARTRLRNVASGTEGLDVVLAGEAVLSGKVVAGSKEVPVAGAELVLRDPDGVTFAESSGEGGAFRFRGLEAAAYTLTATHPDFAPRSDIPIDLTASGRMDDHIVRLESGCAAAGTVTDAESGDPVNGADVTFIRKGRPALTRSTPSGPDGGFEVKGLLAGRYEIRAVAPAFLRTKQPQIEVSTGGVKDLVIALERGGSIAGRVLDPDGKSLARARVQPSMAFTTDEEWNAASESIADVSVETDEEGRYLLEGLPPHGAYLLQASSAGFAPASSPRIPVGPKQRVSGIDLVLEPGGMILGRLTDLHGKPIAGARVRAEKQEEEQYRIYTALDAIGKDAFTDVNGAYTLSPLQTGLYKVKVNARDHLGASRAGVEVPEGGAVEGIDFSLEKAKVLKGRVVDSDGNGIAEAEVAVRGSDQGRARTGKDGRFSAGVPGAGAVVRIQKRGYAGAEIEVEDPGRELTVRLARLGRISGKLEAPGRDSFPSFQVLAVPQGDEAEAIPPTEPVKQTPSGRFEIEVEAGTYVIQATVRGFAPSRSDPVTIQGGETREDVVISLASGGTVKGVVVVRGTGAPIEGARVIARGDEVEPREGFARAGARTGPDGSFTLEGVPERFSLMASHREHAQTVLGGLSLSGGGSLVLKVEMGAGGGIRGTVSRGGAPVAGVRVQALRQGPSERLEKRTVTDAEGHFELARVPPGQYVVTISAPGLPPSQRLVTVRDGEVAELDIAVGAEAGVRLYGRVTSGAAPLALGSITARAGADARGDGAHAFIDREGDYSLDLPGPGKYRLTIETGTRGSLSSSILEVIVPHGVPEHRQDLDLPGDGLGGIVVRAETGEPIAGAAVYAIPAGPTPLSFPADLAGQAWTDLAGRFHIALEPGEYSLLATADGRAEGCVHGLAVGGEAAALDVEIALELGVALVARIIDEQGQPIANAAVFLRDEGGDTARRLEPPRSREDGWAEVTGLRSGPYRLTVVHPAYAPATVRVEAGSGAQPNVVLGPGGNVIVTVTTPDGQPIAGCAIDISQARGGEGIDAVLLEALAGDGRRVTDAEGMIQLDRVPAGTYRIAATKGDERSKEERIVVRPGQLVTAKLTLDAR